MNISLIVSIICFAICLLMFLYLRWYIKKRTTAVSLIAGELNEQKTEVAKLIAEINEVTDRDFLLIEDRVTKLKTLLVEVDKRIELYEKDLESLGAMQIKPDETLYTSLGKGIRSALTAPSPQPSQAPLPFEAAVSALQQTTPQSPPPQTTPSQAKSQTQEQQTQHPQSAADKPPTKKQIRTYIDLLANDGLPPEEIAKRLEISVAEVNLAMNLRRK